MPRPLDVTGTLIVKTPSGTARVTGRGSLVRLDVDDLRVVREFRKQSSGASSDVSQFDSALRHAGLAGELHVRGQRVARLGQGSLARWWSRMLQLGPVEVSLLGLFRSIVARKSTA